MCVEAIEAMLQSTQETRPGPRLLLWSIAWHINRDSGDWPITIRELMCETGLGRTQVYTHLQTLEDSGEILIKHRRNRTSIYRLPYFAGRFAADDQGDELSTVKSGFPDLTHTSRIRNSGFNTSGNPDSTAPLNPDSRKQRGRIPYTGFSLPEEDRPEGDPPTDLSTSIQYRLAGPFSRWQMEQAALAAERKAR